MIINIEQVFLLCIFDGNIYSDFPGEMQNFRYVTVSMVEHAAVNRGVVGSSPTRGVK